LRSLKDRIGGFNICYNVKRFAIPKIEKCKPKTNYSTAARYQQSTIRYNHYYDIMPYLSVYRSLLDITICLLSNLVKIVFHEMKEAVQAGHGAKRLKLKRGRFGLVIFLVNSILYTIFLVRRRLVIFDGSIREK